MPTSEPAALDLRQLKDRSIALCGFMGVGKSTVGRRLASQLGRPFVDVDAVVADQLGASIAAVFEAGGETRFRATESRVIAQVVERPDPSVIALGGGAYEDPATRQLLRERAFVIFLDQSFAALAPSLERLRKGRPLLAGLSNDEIEALYRRRRKNYLLANLTVRVPRAGTPAATRAVMNGLRNYLGAR